MPDANSTVLVVDDDHRVRRHPDVGEAIKRRAIELLTKPFRVQDLLEVIGVGLARSNLWR
jgi:FixJ family two-component response regulator